MLSWLFARITAFSFPALIFFAFLSIPVLSQAAQVTLTWDHNDPAPDGYCIYLRTEGQAYDYNQPCWIGIDTTGTVDGLEANTMHYFVVRAYVADQESADSDEVKFINADCLGTTDSDSDGILDSCDNCILAANADQRDTDGDGYGNICDTDLNNDNITNGLDVGILKTQFLTSGSDADFNGDGITNGLDVGILKTYFLTPPGPSGFVP